MKKKELSYDSRSGIFRSGAPLWSTLSVCLYVFLYVCMYVRMYVSHTFIENLIFYNLYILQIYFVIRIKKIRILCFIEIKKSSLFLDKSWFSTISLYICQNIHFTNILIKYKITNFYDFLSSWKRNVNLDHYN